MKRNVFLMIVLSMAVVTPFILMPACQQPKPQQVKPVTIADGEMDPAEWGKAYPTEYELWKKTEEPTPVGKSRYKRGFDADNITYDKLSEFPFMALLFHGWGFGVEYNEPRGHAYMLKDQLEIDPSRVGAGGVCLTCKTPYAPALEQEHGFDYYSKAWNDVRLMIPEKHQELGVACVDCHDNKDMSLKISRGFTLVKALDAIGMEPDKLTHQQMRSVVCAQCHVTYNIKKDENKKSVGIYFPWQGSSWENIPVENIIKQIRADETVREWTQKVTGYKMPFMRHAEFELFSLNSVHWKAGAACADCHMPYTKVGAVKASNHRVTSPLKEDMKACMQCHTEGAEWLREQVFAIQDRTVSLMLRAGYATATAAKLLEQTHEAQAAGKKIDPEFYEKAKDFYMEAFFRTLYIGGENSTGFHNPTEAGRILGDAVGFAGKSEALLRQALTKAGVDVPMVVDLELDKYLNNRGKKNLMAQPGVEFKDPYGITDRILMVKKM